MAGQKRHIRLLSQPLKQFYPLTPAAATPSARDKWETGRNREDAGGGTLDRVDMAGAEAVFQPEDGPLSSCIVFLIGIIQALIFPVNRQFSRN